MRAVNLLPKDAERTRSEGGRAPLLVGAVGAALVTAAVVALVVSTSGTIDQRRADIDLTEAAIASVPQPDKPAANIGLVVQERADRVAALAAALQTRVPMDRLLREISYVLPEDAWLTGLAASAPVSADPNSPPGTTPAQGPSGAPGVTIQGVTYTHESVARVLSRLEVIPSLADVRLTASARVQPQADKTSDAGTTTKQKPKPTVVTFTVSASLRAGGSS